MVLIWLICTMIAFYATSFDSILSKEKTMILELVGLEILLV